MSIQPSPVKAFAASQIHVEIVQTWLNFEVKTNKFYQNNNRPSSKI